MDKTKRVLPALYSQPIIEKLELPSRAEMLPKIESGEIESLKFQAQVFGTGRIKNPYLFRDQDLPAFASSFEGQPYLRNHNSRDIDARDGTILSSVLQNGVIVQDIQLTTRRGMTDYIEGKMDRFSVGWDYEDAMCTICNSSFFSSNCSHWPGQKYNTPSGEKKCELLFINPSGVETSAVNVPAVENTGIISALEYKQEIIGTAEVAAADDVDEDEPASGQAPESEKQTGKTAQARREYRLRLAEVSGLPILSGDKIMNLRELLSQRAEAIASARTLAKLADDESRDFSEQERAEFDRLMTEAESAGAKIVTITEERARLNAAEADLKQTSTEPEKPTAAAAGAKTLKRAAFEQLSHSERAAFIRGDGKIED